MSGDERAVTMDLRVGELIGAMRGLETGFADFKADARRIEASFHDRVAQMQGQIEDRFRERATQQEIYHQENKLLITRVDTRVRQLERWKIAVVATWATLVGFVVALRWLVDRVSKIAELLK